MSQIERRSFIGAALAAFPFALLGQSLKASTPVTTAGPSAPGKIVPVPAGQDMNGEHHTVGVSTTSFKVSSPQSHGGLFIVQHANHDRKGGPPFHVHHNEDEWFYVLEGEYVVQVESEQFRLKAGDSILGPREIPHTWAFVGDKPGRILIAFAPANKMEEFFRRLPLPDSPKSAYTTDADYYRAYGIDLLGPPISLG